MFRREFLIWGAAAVLIRGLGVGSALAATGKEQPDSPDRPSVTASPC